MYRSTIHDKLEEIKENIEIKNYNTQIILYLLINYNKKGCGKYFSL